MNLSILQRFIHQRTPKVIKDNKLAFILIALIGVSLLVIFSTLIGFAFNSDDNSEQVMAHNLFTSGPHNLLLEVDTFILKFPIYFLFNALSHPSITQLASEALLFNLLMMVLLYFWWRSLKLPGGASWLVLGWLISSGAYWVTQTINPNTRNFEVPLMLVLVFVIVKWLEKPHENNRQFLITGVCIGLIAGILSFNDPYLFFFVIVPLWIAIVIYSLLQKLLMPVIKITTILVIGLMTFRLIWLLAEHHNIHLTRFNEITYLTKTATSSNFLLHKAFNSIGDFLYLFGINLAYPMHHIWTFVKSLFGLTVIGLALSDLIHRLVQRKKTVTDLWLIITYLLAFVYIIAVGSPLVNTIRYLIILVPLTAMLAINGLIRLKLRSARLYKALIVVICLGLLLNLETAVNDIIANGRLKPNAVEYRLASALNKNKVYTAYGDYWLADITYYLDDYKSNVLPTICNSGVVSMDPTLIDTARFNVKSRTTGVITSTDLMVPIIPRALDTSCTVSATIKQFGIPQKMVRISSTVNLLIYDRKLNLPWFK